MADRLSRSEARFVRSLHRARGRYAERVYLAEGERLVADLARSGTPPTFVITEAAHLDRVAQLFPDTPIRVVESGSNVFATRHAQGIAAIMQMPRERTLEELAASDGPMLFFERISDPGNLGTILRGADWFGAAAVVLTTGSVDVYNPKTVRATMGAIARVPVVREVDVTEVAALGRTVYAFDSEGELVLGRDRIDRGAVLAFGEEAHGISQDLRRIAHTVRIEGTGRGESLNVAMAAAIACYQLHCDGG